MTTRGEGTFTALVLFLGLGLAPVVPADATENAARLPPAFHLDDASVPDIGLMPGEAEKKAEAICSVAETPPAAPSRDLCESAFAEARIPDELWYQYECVFVIPPAIGGAGTKKNVWLQPALEAPLKHAVDREIGKRVCNKTMPLAQAQKEIADDWPRAYRHYLTGDVEVVHFDPPPDEHNSRVAPKPSGSADASRDKRVIPADFSQPDAAGGGAPPIEVSVGLGSDQSGLQQSGQTNQNGAGSRPGISPATGRPGGQPRFPGAGGSRRFGSPQPIRRAPSLAAGCCRRASSPVARMARRP